ncbi:MAG: hypothetical protein RLZZ69_92, partial [Cyanobacteriota bacterium]
MLPQALDYGDLGIELLIDRLNDPELEIRAKAYELLQDVELEKAQKAIAPGLLLNPGDIIYSVYRSAMWFTDSSYLVFDYIDDSQAFREEIYGKPEPA